MCAVVNLNNPNHEKMKQIIVFSALLLVAAGAVAQKVAKVQITTTAKITEAIEAVKQAGKGAEYASKDEDATQGKITLWKYVFGLNNTAVEIYATAIVVNGKTQLTLRMPHLPNTFGSYTKDLKKYVSKLVLPDMVTGDYFDGIE